MQPRSDDVAEYSFLTAPGANVDCRLISVYDRQELQLLGNRAGLLSLANIFLWFIANDWHREFISLGELGFVRMDGQLAVCVRLTDEVATDRHGTLRCLDRGESLEWDIAEEGLQQVALWMHRLVSVPAHEYDRLLMAEESACGVHIRMTDAREWLGIPDKER